MCDELGYLVKAGNPVPDAGRRGVLKALGASVVGVGLAGVGVGQPATADIRSTVLSASRMSKPSGDGRVATAQGLYGLLPCTRQAVMSTEVVPPCGGESA